MNLWMQMMLITVLGITTISCKDSRDVLGSQSEGDYLVIPEGVHEGELINRTKLASAIANSVKTISVVSDISFASELYSWEVGTQVITLGTVNLFTDYSMFTASFSVRTHSGNFYRDIQCLAIGDEKEFRLQDCENDWVVIEFYDDVFKIPMNLISV